MTVTMVQHHEWVKHTITPISLLPDPDNDAQVVVIEDPEDAEIAEDQAVFGCNRCGMSMPGNENTICGGPDGTA